MKECLPLVLRHGYKQETTPAHGLTYGGVR
uniref:Uncharacterized protein n=1 Tax=Anguilla anguilla TaxID=7936 RepID=A0A0E9RR64_ANGAN